MQFAESCFWGLVNEIETFDQFRVHSRYNYFFDFVDCLVKYEILEIAG